ncbi:MAG: twin-arginine translocation signal domain-containing protein [Campylobacter sp.]|nr:twin-arginine translocation signal domain-containing protein [Campylobacter sp.]MCI6694298.1 twin-arginine translocation signal domain-containing protein [Campylobacter sp.]
MLQNRRKFLQKALGVGAIAVASAATAAKLNVNANPVPQGKSKKQEVLYRKTPLWEQYYKIAY